MAITPNNDIEAIDAILREIYGTKIPYLFTEKSVLHIFNSSFVYDIDRILRKMNKLDLITNLEKADLGFGKSENIFRISDFGIELVNEYGSYLSYTEHGSKLKKKEEVKLLFDRYIKNGNTIAALLISSLSLILTQCPISSNKEQTKIKEGLESVAKELDSLKKAIRNTPLQIDKKVIQDTATNK